MEVLQLKRCTSLLVMMWSVLVCGQSFTMLEDKKYEKFRFENIGELIYFPVVLNGVTLNFILDSGANKTVILNLSQNDSINLNETEEIYITGLGKKEPFKAIKSVNNVMQIGNLIDKHHEVYIVTDEEINFSKKIGVTVHGIIGFDILKDFVVEIDYARSKIKFYPYQQYDKRVRRRDFQTPLIFNKNKPYVDLFIRDSTRVKKEVRLLIDTGSGDGLWLFESDKIKVPSKFFEDYLGVGLNGDIFGKRSKIENLLLGKFQLNNVKTAYPNEEFVIHANQYEQREGSVGGEVLSRFVVTINYRKGWVRFRKGKNYNKPFYYNMSGITIQHNGYRVIEERKQVNEFNNSNELSGGRKNSYTSFYKSQLQYSLAPAIEIADIRKDSPADLSGLQKGDVIVKINRRRIEKKSLNDVYNLLNQKDGKKISLTIIRNGQTYQYNFILKKLL